MSVSREELDQELDAQTQAQATRIEAINARITESERAMTTWVETQMATTRALIEIEEGTRRDLAGIVGHHEATLETVRERILELHTGVGRLEKEAVGISEILATTEHSEDRRHAKAIPTAKGYRIEASVELYGSDNHIVGQELASLIEECRQELKQPLEEATS